MRINLVPRNITFPQDGASSEWLMKLLADQDVVLALIKRITPTSVLLQINQKEVELPRAGFSNSLFAGDLVELKRHDERTLPFASAPEEQPALIPRQLEQVLLELNIPATFDTLLVAQELLERGFPLKEGLIWALLPWAEQGELKAAFTLLEARFPLKGELLEVLNQLKGRGVGDVILPGAKGRIPADLQELFKSPKWDNRQKWISKLTEGETFKVLARLLVEERLLEALLNKEGGVGEYVFALPYLRSEDLHAGWVRITREDSCIAEAEEQKAGLRIELQIPTIAWGVVGAELYVQGKKVRLILKVEEEDAELLLGEYQNSLEKELRQGGWNLTTLQVKYMERTGGLGYAKSSGFTL